MTDLDTRVRQAFDNVTVPDDVKRGTLTYIASIAEASGVSAETAPASAAAPRKRARARIELVELDPSVTLEECASLSMRELRDRIAALSSGDSEGRGSGNGQHGHGGGGGQHGKGNR